MIRDILGLILNIIMAVLGVCLLLHGKTTLGMITLMWVSLSAQISLAVDDIKGR